MKKFVKYLFMAILVLPLAFMIAACGDKEPDDTTSPETPAPAPTNTAEVSEILVSLADTDNFIYDADTKTIMFEYGTAISFEKDDFSVSAKDEAGETSAVSDFEIDASALAGTPNVGDYEIKFSAHGKQSTFKVKVNPKKIAKPTFIQENYVFVYEEVGGQEVEFEAEVIGFDANTMTYSADTVMSATKIGTYKIEIDVKSNYEWEEFDDNSKEKVTFEWMINKRVANMASPEALEFTYDGTEKTIVFEDIYDEYKFADWYEVVAGESTLSATEIGDYEVVVTLKTDKISTYTVYETMYTVDLNFVYLDAEGNVAEVENATKIKYFWSIV